MRPEPARSLQCSKVPFRALCAFYREQQFWFAERLVQQMSPPATVPAVVGTETSAARGAHALERGHTIASNTSKSTGV